MNKLWVLFAILSLAFAIGGGVCADLHLSNTSGALAGAASVCGLIAFLAWLGED